MSHPDLPREAVESVWHCEAAIEHHGQSRVSAESDITGHTVTACRPPRGGLYFNSFIFSFERIYKVNCPLML